MELSQSDSKNCIQNLNVGYARHSISYQRRAFNINSPSPIRKERRSSIMNFGHFNTPRFPKTSKFLVNLRKKNNFNMIIKKSRNLLKNCFKYPVTMKTVTIDLKKKKSNHKKSLSNCFTNSNTNTKQNDSHSPSMSSHKKSRMISLSETKSLGYCQSVNWVYEDEFFNSMNRVNTVGTLAPLRIKRYNEFRKKTVLSIPFFTEQKKKTNKSKFASLLSGNQNIKYKLKVM